MWSFGSDQPLSDGLRQILSLLNPQTPHMIALVLSEMHHPDRYIARQSDLEIAVVEYRSCGNPLVAGRALNLKARHRVIIFQRARRHEQAASGLMMSGAAIFSHKS
jgi:hypothetical protein